jgi:hypothetical protein
MNNADRLSDRAKRQAFIDEYKALCEKHGFFVMSCDCCEGPSLEPIRDNVADECNLPDRALWSTYRGGIRGERTNYWEHLAIVEEDDE